MTWERVGGGSFVGERGLSADTQYESNDGRTIEFLSTQELRYGDFFPEEMSEEEMDQFIKNCEGREDVKAGSINNPSSAWLFDRALAECGILSKIAPPAQAESMTTIVKGQVTTMPAPQNPLAWELYEKATDYLMQTDGEGHEDSDRQAFVRVLAILAGYELPKDG